jgi:hypothetical protein
LALKEGVVPDYDGNETWCIRIQWQNAQPFGVRTVMSCGDRVDDISVRGDNHICRKHWKDFLNLNLLAEACLVLNN